MDRRTAIKAMLAGLLAPKIVIDALGSPVVAAKEPSVLAYDIPGQTWGARYPQPHDSLYSDAAKALADEIDRQILLDYTDELRPRSEWTDRVVIKKRHLL